MLAGMVQVRNPYNIEKARRQTEEYLKQLAELNSPLLDMYRQPAGSHSKAREDIPYFFAWSLLEGQQQQQEEEGEQQPPAEAAVIKEPPAKFPLLHGQAWAEASSSSSPDKVGSTTGPATGAGDVLQEGSRGVRFDLHPEGADTCGATEEEATGPRLRPYLPLRSRRKLGVPPKIGEARPVEDGLAIVLAGSEAARGGEGRGSEEGGEEGEEMLTEYQRAFHWPDPALVVRAKPCKKQTSSSIFAKDDLELLKIRKRVVSSFVPGRSSDHLWSLLTTDLPLPQPPTTHAQAGSSRPDTDQLWELLEPDLPLPSPAPASSSSELLLVDEDAPAFSEKAGQPSPAAASDVTDPHKPRSSRSSREARRAAKEAERAAKAEAASSTARPPSSSLLGGRGRRKQPKKSGSSSYKSFNPILMNPRYVPKLRPKDIFTTEYNARFIWPTASSLVTPL